MQHVVERVPKVPVSLIRVSSYTRAVFPAVVPFLVDLSQISILVDVVQKDEHTIFCRITKAGSRRSGKFAKERGEIRSHVEAAIGENDRDGVDARCLAFLIGKNMTNGVVIKPECLSTVGYRSLNGLDGRFERPDENVFVISMRGLTKCGHLWEISTYFLSAKEYLERMRELGP